MVEHDPLRDEILFILNEEVELSEDEDMDGNLVHEGIDDRSIERAASRLTRLVRDRLGPDAAANAAVLADLTAVVRLSLRNVETLIDQLSITAEYSKRARLEDWRDRLRRALNEVT